jgi:hypothetical protein
MRSIRVVVLVVLAVVVSAGCTNPMGPKPAGDTTQSSNTATGGSGNGGE